MLPYKNQLLFQKKLICFGSSMTSMSFQSQFISQKDKAILKLNLKKEGEDKFILLIELSYKEDNDKYFLVLTQELIAQDYPMFDTPGQIYHELQSNPSLNFKNKGILSFILPVGKTKKEVKLKMLNIQKKDQGDILLLSAEMKDLKASVKKLKEQHKNQLHYFGKIIGQQAVCLEKMKKKIKKLQKYILHLDNKDSHVKTEVQQEEKSQKSSAVLTQQTNQEIIVIQKLLPHPDHQNNHHFRVYDKKILQKIDQEFIWENFILKQPISKNKRTFMTLFIIRSSAYKINFGVCSRKLFGHHNSRKNAQSITGDLTTGSIWVKGKETKTLKSWGVKEGTYIKMEVDMINGQIRWFKRVSMKGKSQMIGQVDIPNYLLKNELYFMITIFNDGDQIELIEDQE